MKHLAHYWLDVLRRLGQPAVVDRHVAPAKQHLAFVADCTFDHGFAGTPAGVAARQEHHAHAVMAGGRQGDALFRHFLTQELVGNLDQDAGAVAEQGIVAGGATMFEVFQDFQALLDDGVALLVLDMGNKADAAGVTLVFGVVETLALGEDHRVFPRNATGYRPETAGKKAGAMPLPGLGRSA
jgi:hypothetical protein